MFKQIIALLPLVRPHPWLALGWLLSFVLSSILLLALPIASALVVDGRVAAEGHRAAQIAWLAGGAALVAATFAARFVLSSLLADRVVLGLRVQLFERMIHKDSRFFDMHSSGELVSRLTLDVELVRSLISQTLPSILRSVLVAAGSIATIVATHATLTIWLLVGMFASLAPVLLASRWLNRLSGVSQMDLASSIGLMRELLGHVRTVQTYGREGQECGRVRDSLRTASTANDRRVFAHGSIAGVSLLIAIATLVGTLTLALGYLREGAFTAGELSQFVLGALLATLSLASLAEAWSEVSHVSGGLSEVARFLREPEYFPDGNIQNSDTSGGAWVRFKAVGFAYSSRPDVQVLSDLDLEIRPGETVVVVGPSGSGKSTLLSLVLGFYEPDSGAVTVDGVSPRNSGQAKVREFMAYVPQEPAIFSATLRDNIRYSHSAATEEQLDAVVDSAYLQDVVAALTDGLDARVGGETQRLSGGQKQRVEFARALLRTPRLLLLDEPTSALDPASEAAVVEALHGKPTGRTTIITSHRLSTILKGDRIIFMDGGKCVAIGSHNDLLATCPAYVRFIERNTDALSPVPATASYLPARSSTSEHDRAFVD